jgi:hypothetical protein
VTTCKWCSLFEMKVTLAISTGLNVNAQFEYLHCFVISLFVPQCPPQWYLMECDLHVSEFVKRGPIDAHAYRRIGGALVMFIAKRAAKQPILHESAVNKHRSPAHTIPSHDDSNKEKKRKKGATGDAVVRKNQHVCSQCQRIEAAFASLERSYPVHQKVRRRVTAC